MGKFKVAVTALLYFGSCIALAATHGAVSAILKSYTAGYPGSLGTHVPAFTSTALSLMPYTAIVCFGTLVVSAALAALVIWRSKSIESKLYWVTVLACISYYISTFLLSTVLIGFFLLPKLANGT
jgi:hypothetical protein